MPLSYGSSQASAFTCTTTSGGKTGRPSGSLSILQPSHPFEVEPLPPFGDDLARQIQSLPDCLVVQSFRRQKEYLRSHNNVVRGSVLAAEPFQIRLLPCGKHDGIRAFAWHIPLPEENATPLFYVSVIRRTTSSYVTVLAKRTTKHGIQTPQPLLIKIAAVSPQGITAVQQL